MTQTDLTESRQYLTFTLADETFAFDIAQVREVLDYTNVTKVPRTPPFMRGVINLRGNVVPVVDMRLKFDIPAAEATVNSCIIIVEVAVDGETTVLGAMADSVQEVLELDPSQIEPPPRIGAKLNTDFIRGMGKRGDEFIIVLEIDKIFTSEEIDATGAMPEGRSEVVNG